MNTDELWEEWNMLEPGDHRQYASFGAFCDHHELIKLRSEVVRLVDQVADLKLENEMLKRFDERG